MTDKDLERMYQEYLDFNTKQIEQYDTLSVAAVMMAQALSIYKTVLSEEDFDDIVDTMSDSRDNVKKFTNKEVLQ
jgi:hypothetical protein